MPSIASARDTLRMRLPIITASSTSQSNWVQPSGIRTLPGPHSPVVGGLMNITGWALFGIKAFISRR